VASTGAVGLGSEDESMPRKGAIQTAGRDRPGKRLNQRGRTLALAQSSQQGWSWWENGGPLTVDHVAAAGHDGRKGRWLQS